MVQDDCKAGLKYIGRKFHPNCCYMNQIELLRSKAIAIILLLYSQVLFSQVEPPAGFRVTGKVTDEAGKPIEGVTVQVKGAPNAPGKSIFSITKRDGSLYPR